MSARNDAAEAAEFRRWQGHGLRTSIGCKIAQLSLGEATVTVEYEFTASGGDGWSEPRYDAEVSVIAVLINGALIPAEGFIDSDQIDRWEEDLLVSEGELGPDYYEPERERLDAIGEQFNRIMDGQERRAA